MHFVASNITGDEDGGIGKVVFIEFKLRIRLTERCILPFGLVFHREAALVPHVSEALFATRLGKRLLKAKKRTARVGLHRPFEAEQFAQRVKVRLGDRLLIECNLFPVLNKLLHFGGRGHSGYSGA